MVQFLAKARQHSRQRGDTLTEVMFATAVAALVIILSMTAMNRSFAQTEMTVENTLVRQSMDAQAELLRYARDNYNNNPNGDTGLIWRQAIANAKDNDQISSFGSCPTNSGSSPTMPTNSFFIDDSNLANPVLSTTFVTPETYAAAGQGLWIEAVKGHTNQGIAFLDFQIRACWEPPYSGPDATLGTIVRLYYENN